jgi:hypothetical protein
MVRPWARSLFCLGLWAGETWAMAFPNFHRVAPTVCSRGIGGGCVLSLSTRATSHSLDLTANPSHGPEVGGRNVMRRILVATMVAEQPMRLAAASALQPHSTYVRRMSSSLQRDTRPRFGTMLTFTRLLIPHYLARSMPTLTLLSPSARALAATSIRALSPLVTICDTGHLSATRTLVRGQMSAYPGHWRPTPGSMTHPSVPLEHPMPHRAEPACHVNSRG